MLRQQYYFLVKYSLNSHYYHEIFAENRNTPAISSFISTKDNLF